MTTRPDNEPKSPAGRRPAGTPGEAAPERRPDGRLREGAAGQCGDRPLVPPLESRHAKHHGPGPRSANAQRARRVRFANALVASAVAVFFLAHSALGSLSLGIAGLSNDLPWLVWAALAVVSAHVVLCACATVLLLTDRERPPSDRKKRHFVLKWTTGLVLAAAIGAHVANLPLAAPLRPWLMAAAAAALLWHVTVAAKSLTRDLHLGKAVRDPLRAAYAGAVVAFLCIIASAVL